MHLGSIAVIGRFAGLAADLLTDLCVTVVIMPPKKKSSPWQPTYKQKLELRVTNLDVKTSAVIEEKWSEYQALLPSEQLKFFDGIVSRNNTLHRYIEIDDDKLTFKISNDVVDTIIGELLFRPEDEMAALEHDNGEALDPNIAKRATRLIKLKRNALLLFKLDDEANDGSYIVMIKNVERFQLIIKHVSCGMSFWQIAAVIGHMRNVMNIKKLSGVSDHLVGQYVRVLVGIALTKIGVLFSSDDVWAFSIAFDGSTHHGTAFFDVRIRISVKGILYNFHLIAMPHFGRHTVDL
ncbi:unnamed protein product [Sphagnum tenellum]